MKLKIQNKFIGDNYPTFIIAEIGVNHNGKKNIAKKLISKAKKSGADAVKFQTFKADNLASPDSKSYSILKGFELDESDFSELSDFAKRENIIFLSTPSSIDDVNFLAKIKVPAFKISSGDLTNIPLLEHISLKKKPILLSTGMGNFKEISLAIESITKKHNNKIAILHSISGYPTPSNEANLNVINSLKNKYSFPIGYSDNGSGIDVSSIAVAAGAKLIEKHFTLDKKMIGPDHKMSSNPSEFLIMVKRIREIETILGSCQKTVQPSEKVNVIQARKSVTAIKTIEKGTKITNTMISIMRPAKGIDPKDFNKVIGKKTNKKILKFQSLNWKYLS